MRNLVYYVALSVDGFIAHPDGSFEGFSGEGQHVTDYLESFAAYDTVLMGRRTYEVGLNAGVTNPYPGLKSFVFSKTMDQSPDPLVTLVREDALETVRGLKAEEGKPIYLCGGANLAAQCFDAGLIDTLIIKLNPFIMGTGIPLFEGVTSLSQLAMTKHTAYPNGVVFLHYVVQKAA